MIEHLTIHIGIGKTGTTSIQEFLERNRTILEAAGCRVVVPEAADEIDALSYEWEVPDFRRALGIIGDKPAEIVDVLDAQSQISFKVFAIWE